jgi:hypothetical protein
LYFIYSDLPIIIYKILCILYILIYQSSYIKYFVFYIFCSKATFFGEKDPVNVDMFLLK